MGNPTGWTGSSWFVGGGWYGTSAAASSLTAGSYTIGWMEIMGIDIRTIISDNVAKRCGGCGDVIDGTPWRVNVLDIVAPEAAVSWAERASINPGPFQFHGDPDHVRRWMAAKGYLFCRKGEIREIMRPIVIPGSEDAPDAVRYGLCDGIHRDDHEFVPA